MISRIILVEVRVISAEAEAEADNPYSGYRKNRKSNNCFDILNEKMEVMFCFFTEASNTKCANLA